MTDRSAEAAPVEPDAELHRLLDARLLQQARRGVLAAFTIRALGIAAGVVGIFVATLPARKLAPKFFQMPPVLIFESWAFGLISLAFFLLAARSKRPLMWCYISMFVDVLCLSQLKFFWIWALPNSQDVPLFIVARYSDVLILGIIIAIYALPLSFRLLWTTGAACAAMWVGGIVYTFVKFGRGQLFWGPMGPGALQRISEPGTLFPDYLVNQALLLFCFTGFVALLTLAAHRYLTARVVAERRAVSLLRYFPPGLGERARQADALAPVRRRVAVLFVSEMAASAYTAEAFSTLGKHYREVEASVFAHDGVIDRFTGGPIMATFGALADEPDAVERAYACASALGPQGRVVALHLGEAVCGAIGEGGLTAFSVVGDVVHVARRILDEAQRRSLSLVASGEAAGALAATGALGEPTGLGSFVPRGRETEVALWTWPESAHG